MKPIPDIIDNRKNQLGQILREIISQSQNPRLDVLTAFFNLEALEVLEPELKNLKHLRLLLGKEQEQSFVLGALFSELENRSSLAEIATSEIEKWREFFSDERIEIRLYSKNFVHGKVYILYDVPVTGTLGIVGSSNFTGAGLTANMELNAVLKQESAVRELIEWFDSLWNEAEDYRDKFLEILERFTQAYTPYEIYIKVIYEYLRDKLDQDIGEKDRRPSIISLSNFQYDGYLAAKEILENYGGVLIADSVGLGKTYLALRLLEDYAYHERQTALIICPASISQTVWEPLLKSKAIPHEIVSMEMVSRKDFPVNDYAEKFNIIVVDESHNFRNPGTNRWKNLFNIITGGEREKKVILLSATPVNNTIFDLYHQLRFITRDEQGFLAFAGIKDLFEYFKRAENNKEALYEVLEALAVRRSRQFIKKNYPDAEIDGQKIKFPDRKLHAIRYSLAKTYGSDLYERIAKAIENLSLAPYQIDGYRRILSGTQISERIDMQELKRVLKSEDKAKEFAMLIGRQKALAGIMRVLFLKRLESSIESLRISMRRLYEFFERFAEALERGRLLNTREYQFFESSDDEDTSWDDLINSLPVLSPEEYDVEKIKADVEADKRSLKNILEDLKSEHHDDKMKVLRELLLSRKLEGKKVIVFSYFKDTARYIYNRLRNDPDIMRQWKMTIVDSDVRPDERKERIRKFSPKSNGVNDLAPEDEFNLLISTDVLSEGQNLQDADVIINYDLHWNPIRMVQRIGRLDRLGSPHDLIHVYNFFPEDKLDELLGLMESLRRKLSDINRTIGLDASVLGEMPNPISFNILRRLNQEDMTTLEELENESELIVGEFLKQDLLRFLKKRGEEELKRIPFGVGTARRGDEGVRGFFVAFRNTKTNQHYWLFYDMENEKIIERRLEAIKKISCDDSQPLIPLPENFDPRPFIQKLRKHLLNRIREVKVKPRSLPKVQRNIVNWLRSLPSSSERNRLLQYFEERQVAGTGSKELNKIWRERTSLTPEEMIKRLINFVEEHPHPASPVSGTSNIHTPESEDELECIAWMLVE